MKRVISGKDLELDKDYFDRDGVVGLRYKGRGFIYFFDELEYDEELGDYVGTGNCITLTEAEILNLYH